LFRRHGYSEGMNERKSRLDTLLVARGLAETREKAKRLILAGSVVVNGQATDKPAMMVKADSAVSVREGLAFVSRGGLKLQAALEAFGLDVSGLTAADFGASTGGFTDCLLQHGVRRVYAVDVGHGQLAAPLQRDPRVILMDRTNARHLESLPEPIDLVTIDVSFISLALILPAARRVLRAHTGQVIALVKPQFEAGKERIGKGVVRDPAIHREVLDNVQKAARELGFRARGLIRSPITGPAGTVEFLIHLALAGDEMDWAAAVERVLQV